MNWKKIFIWLFPLFALLTIPLANVPLGLHSLREDISWSALPGSYLAYAEFFRDGAKHFHMYVYRPKNTEPIDTGEKELVLNPCLYPAALFMLCLLGSFWFWLKKPGWFSACCTLFVAWGLCGWFGLATIALAGSMR